MMREICLHIPANVCEARLFELVRDASGKATETPLRPPSPIDVAQFQPGAPLDPVTLVGLFTANADSPQFLAKGLELLNALGVGPTLSKFLASNQDNVRIYLCVEHALLREVPWEVLSADVRPLFSKAPWMRVKTWPLPQLAANPNALWPIRILVVDATDPDDKNIRADEEIWEIRKALRAAEHSFDLEVFRTALDPTFTVDRIEELMVAEDDNVRRWPGGPHIFHFIGHAVPGLLKFWVHRDGAGTGEKIDWTRGQINLLMDNLPQLKLAYLSACDSELRGPVVWLSTAEAFLDAGHPVNATIAMQANVRGKAAALCAREFYSELAKCTDPDAALQKARSKLLAAFNENSPNMYTPVMTTRVAGAEILPRRKFAWTAADDAVWQNGLRTGTGEINKDNWAHFVDQRPGRRDLLNCLLAPEGFPLLVHGEDRVGKTWLLRWISYGLALNGRKTIYVEANAEMDWLRVLRSIRDGNAGEPYSPGLEKKQQSEFNWKLNHLVQGKIPEGSPPEDEKDQAPPRIEVQANGSVPNSTDRSICDAMADALRVEATTKPLVLILDNLPMATLAVLKPNLLDQLLDAAQIRVILGHRNADLDGTQGWRKVAIPLIPPLLARDLAREILRLRFPKKDTSAAEQWATGGISVPNSIGKLWDLCLISAEYKGLL